MSREGRILILGNGFDMDLGLKTGYHDFMNDNQYWPFADSLKDISPLSKMLKEIKEQNWYDVGQAQLLKEI